MKLASKLILSAVLSLSLASFAVAATHYEVIITDEIPGGMATGQPFSPPVCAIHDAGYSLFMPGAMASPGLEIVAREGNPTMLAAEAMASAKGVDLCALPHDGGWQVLGGRGRAQIRRRESDGDTLWSYDALAGDPLLYLPIVERLESDGHGQRADGLVWFRDQEWFEATDRAEYADALYRISRAFDLAENPASIACSVDIDSMYGAASTVFGSRLSLGRLRWTHGALLAWPSYGFLLSDVPELEHERPVRFDQALAPLAPARREEARQQADP